MTAEAVIECGSGVSVCHRRQRGAQGTEDSSWTPVRTVGSAKKSLCRIKGTMSTVRTVEATKDCERRLGLQGARVAYKSSWASVRTMGDTGKQRYRKGKRRDHGADRRDR
ncbi:hypothetical protein ACLKA6_018799 [Drosophila palustris]